MEPIAVQPPPAYQPRMVSYAGFWKRFVAYIIDSIILSIVSFVVVIPLLAMIGIGVLTPGDSDLSEGLIFALISAYISLIIFLMIGQWLYFALMESLKGATLGKMALGIIVTDMNGNSISFGRATGRYFAKIISGLIFCIGYIMAGFTQQKQALHDIIVGCLVVNK
jgi:uncharacterized RDD family membrane protein YckC